MTTPPGDDDDRFLESLLPPRPGPADPVVRATVSGAVNRAAARRVVTPPWAYASLVLACASVAILVLRPGTGSLKAPAPPPPVMATADPATEPEGRDAEDPRDALDAPGMLDLAVEDLSDEDLEELAEGLGVDESWNG